jgi:hypothetical protein
MRLALVVLLVAACHKSTTAPATTPSPPPTHEGSSLTAAECKGLGGETTPDESCPMKLMCNTTNADGSKHAVCVAKPDAAAP